jgi:hypothetical protein
MQHLLHFHAAPARRRSGAAFDARARATLRWLATLGRVLALGLGAPELLIAEDRRAAGWRAPERGLDGVALWRG